MCIWFIQVVSHQGSFYCTNLHLNHFCVLGSISSIEILPIYPPQSGDKQLEDPTKFFMDAILEFMVTQVQFIRFVWQSVNIICTFFIESIVKLCLFCVLQVSRIEWKDKQYKQHRCFTFLFDRFRQYYLPTIFPEFSSKTSLFKPHLGKIRIFQ